MAIGANIVRRIGVLVILILSIFVTPSAFALGGYTMRAPFLTTQTREEQSSFHTMDALGINPAVSPVDGVIRLSNGALYYRQYTIEVTGVLWGTANLTTYVRSNFVHSNALVLRHCPLSGGCTGQGGYTNTPTTSGTAATLASGIGNGTYTIGMAIFVPDNNGAAAFTGSEGAVVRLTLTWILGTLNLDINLNAPPATVQTGLRLNLLAAAGGLSIDPGGTQDYRMNFGNVNGLGIGPAPGLTVTAVAGGVMYATPYQIEPAFTGFTSTTARVRAYVNPNFAHPSILGLNRSDNLTGPFQAITTSSGSPTLINASAQSRASFTRYLGLFVSNSNGPAAFTGTDSATLTFVLTVP